MATRTYVLGIPLAITVSDDGPVTLDVDLSDIDLFETAYEHYDDDVIDADEKTVNDTIADPIIHARSLSDRTLTVRLTQNTH